MTDDLISLAARRLLADALEPSFPYRARVLRRGSLLPKKEQVVVDVIADLLRDRARAATENRHDR